MRFTKEQRELIKGSGGETMAKVMKTLVRYGRTFGADRFVPITSEYNHLALSYGTKMLQPMYELMEGLIEAGALSGQKFTVNPRPLDKAVPAPLLHKLLSKKLVYPHQQVYEEQLKKLGLLREDAFTCTCYLDQVGNQPKVGDVLSWSEPSAVIYANSVLGARCNRNPAMIDLMGSIAGMVPRFGLLTEEGREAKWIVKIRTSKIPEAQLLGSAIGLKVKSEVPYLTGLKKWLGTELTEGVRGYLKDMGGALASHSTVGLYHVESLTPEAKERGADLIGENCKVYVIDDGELERVRKEYPILWKRKDAKPELCFVGCPHLSMQQLVSWTLRVERALGSVNRKKVGIPTVFTAAPAVIRSFEKTEYARRLKATGVILSYICPLLYMNDPMCGSVRVITPSAKLRGCSTARYYTETEILYKITKGGTIT